MTVVAFATSTPELLVSLLAAIKGSADIATGNIIGSNVANIGLILGAAAVLQPLRVSRKTLLREIPIMILAGVILYLMALDGVISFGNGLTLFVLLLAFLYYCLRIGKDDASGAVVDPEVVRVEQSRRGGDLVLVLVGIIGLGVGAELMVRSAVTMARHFGLSELMIGMTIVALGTSLPELAASVMSAWKGEMDLSVGNVIGSNIFNILFVLGLCPMLKPLAVEPSVLRFEMPYMLAMAVLLIPLLWHRQGLGRGKGTVLLGGYGLFILLMILREAP
jgi:cation:H+ antiporter